MVFLGAVFIMHWLGWGFSTAILILSIGSFFFSVVGFAYTCTDNTASAW